jgi:hypothetical protein
VTQGFRGADAGQFPHQQAGTVSLTVPVKRDRAMGKRTHGVHLVALLGVVLIGCGGRGTTPVRGVITLEGTPIAGATVLFMPDGQDEGRPASGFTSSDGTFRLMTYKPDDGALPGTYRVLIQKTEAAKDPGAAQQSALERAKARIEEKSLQKRRKPTLPEAYARFNTTPLRCRVPVTGAVTFNLDKVDQH